MNNDPLTNERTLDTPTGPQKLTKVDTITPEQWDSINRFERVLKFARTFLKDNFSGANLQLLAHEELDDFDYERAADTLVALNTALHNLQAELEPNKKLYISAVRLGGELSYNSQFGGLSIPIGAAAEEIYQVVKNPPAISVVAQPVENESTTEKAPPSLDDIRKEYISTAAAKSKRGILGDITKANEAEAKYYEMLEKEKQKIVQKVYEEHGVIDPGVLTPEDAALLAIEAKRRIFDELVAKEHGALMAEREATRKQEGGSEKYKAYLEKGLNWYTGLTKGQRFAITFTLGTAAGLLAGAAASMGVASYAAMRGLRMGGSMLASGVVGKAAQKRWSLEEAEKMGEEKKGELREKFEEGDLKKAAEEYATIEKETTAEKRKRMWKKTAVTVGAGAGAGFLAGALEHFGTSGGGGSSVLEQKGGKSVIAEKAPSAKATISAEAEPAPKPVIPKEVAKEAIKVAEVKNELAPQIVDVEKGESVTSLTKLAATQNPKFNALPDEAQKTYVVSSLTNETMKNPSSYGLSNGDNLSVGNKVDISKLLGDKAKFEELIEKAQKLSETQKNSIITNNRAIENWVKAHPNELLDESKVSEILSAKNTASAVLSTDDSEALIPRAEAQEYVMENGLVEEKNNIAGGQNNEVTVDETGVHGEKSDFEYVNESNQSEPPETPSVQNVPEPMNQVPTRPELQSQLAGAGGLAAVTAINKTISKRHLPVPEQRELQKEIAAARTTPAVSNERKVLETRSMKSDLEATMLPKKLTVEVAEAFEADIDGIYGQSKMFGLGHLKGVATKEWQLMRKLLAKDVMEFYSKDSTASELPLEVKEVLSKTSAHRKMVAHLQDLVGITDGKVKPFNNENVEDFFIRLGGYILRANELAASNEQLVKAA